MRSIVFAPVSLPYLHNFPLPYLHNFSLPHLHYFHHLFCWKMELLNIVCVVLLPACSSVDTLHNMFDKYQNHQACKPIRYLQLNLDHISCMLPRTSWAVLLRWELNLLYKSLGGNWHMENYVCATGPTTFAIYCVAVVCSPIVTVDNMFDKYQSHKACRSIRYWPLNLDHSSHMLSCTPLIVLHHWELNLLYKPTCGNR